MNHVDTTTATIRNSKVYGNYYGFYINDADNVPVQIDSDEIYNNSRIGIFLVNADDDVNIINSEIHSHNVNGNGAALLMGTGSSATISKTIIRDNVTTGQCGAICTNLANITIENSIFAITRLPTVVLSARFLIPIRNQASATYAPADDIDGDSRPEGAGDDMGADEYLP